MCLVGKGRAHLLPAKPRLTFPLQAALKAPVNRRMPFQALPKPAGGSTLGTCAASPAFKRQRTATGLRCQDDRVRDFLSAIPCILLRIDSLPDTMCSLLYHCCLQGAEPVEEQCVTDASSSVGQPLPVIRRPHKEGCPCLY